MQQVIEDAKQSANERTRDGRPVFKHQEIRFKFADMLTLAQTAQLLAYRAGWLYSVRDPDAESVTHCAKVFAAEAAEKVAAMGMQIAAADGYVHGHALERRYREAKYPSIAGTTNERARMAIAENLLDRYRI
jgi:alkylation response protein AidB-like acyl-CoA dehydrogenase